ncbi:MAG TPA: META domain-containing protein [Rubrivivax sp.]
MAACASTTVPAPPSPSPLAGTEWQLVAIVSMAGEQPTARPPDPSNYTLVFGTDGRATLHLDCNRGSATWQASAAPGDTPGRRSGSLGFGALVSTRASCAPASLEPRVVQALPFVRTHVLLDDRLHLSLMADGGILVWAPAPRRAGTGG